MIFCCLLFVVICCFCCLLFAFWLSLFLSLFYDLFTMDYRNPSYLTMRKHVIEKYRKNKKSKSEIPTFRYRNIFSKEEKKYFCFTFFHLGKALTLSCLSWTKEKQGGTKFLSTVTLCPTQGTHIFVVNLFYFCIAAVASRAR